MDYCTCGEVCTCDGIGWSIKNGKGVDIDTNVKFEYDGIKYLWEDCTVGFICPICGAELVGNSQDGKSKCECGFKYMLSAKLIWGWNKE